jgi:hypothetical protein
LKAKPGNPAGPPRNAGRITVNLSTALVYLAVIVLEAVWLIWWLAEPLPNAANIGGAVRRWMFLARALPEVIPGIGLHDSYLGMALAELSHVGNLHQRGPIVLVAALIGGAAIGLGGLTFRALGLDRSLSMAERLPLAFAVGAAELGVITLLLGRLVILAAWPVRIGLAALMITDGVLSLRERRSSGATLPADRVPPALSVLGFLLIIGPFLVLMALGAMLPTVDFDAIEYHLQGPKEYFQAGRISFLPHNVYTSMPFGVEMLHLLAMVVMGDWWWGALSGQLLIAAHAPAAAMMIGLTASRWGSPRAGWFAAVVYLTTPWVYRLGVLPYVEGPLCDYHAALLWAATRAWTEPQAKVRTRLWALAGLLAGGAMGCKYPALVSAVIPFGLVALVDAIRRRSVSAVVAFSVGWAVVMTAWLVKNVVDTGNPVYPLGYAVFGGRYWDTAMDRKWSNAHGPRPISVGLLWSSVVDVAGRSDWQSALYLCLAPLAFLRAGSRKFAGAVAGYAAYLFITWWLLTHRLDRFWLPLLPALAVLAGLGADWTRRLGWSILLGCLLTLVLITNLTYVTTALTGLNEWTEDLLVLRKSVPEMINSPLARLDAALPAGAKVLLVGQAAVFHMEHALVYNTVFDDETFETIAKGRSPDEVRAELKRRGITHVYVDWHEIERYRSPGNYGFTDFVTEGELDRLEKAGVLERADPLGSERLFYQVR